MFADVPAYLDELRQSFRLADALDIALIAALVYAVVVWFKQTASRNMVVGVVVITALYVSARTFNLHLTSLVFHTAFAVLLIVLVVVFQEEIRRVFERVAGWGTLREFRPRTTALVHEVDDLVEASFTLASNRTGALIVLKGREELDRHVDGGIALSGRISKPALYSVFDPSSAGHDGAVIIERDRIEKFGAHLPISKNHKQIRGRGTRHSAALGISECSDALTIVVSEERGVVSIAERAKLVELQSAADLKSRVERFLEDRFPQNPDTAWQRVVKHDIRWKLLALLLAVVAWFVFVFNVEKVQRTVVVPIEYRSLPGNAVIDESTPVDALVTLSGSERAFDLLDPRVLKISLDLRSVQEGSLTVPITLEDVRAPPNLTVDAIQPEEIRVRIKSPPTSRDDEPEKT